MHLRPGLDALERLINARGVIPLKEVPDFLGTADLYLAAEGDERLCLMEGREVSLELSQCVLRKGILADAFVLIVRHLGPKGDIRRDPRIPEKFEASECSHIVLWSLENPPDSRENSYAKLTLLDIESVSERSVWLSEQAGIQSIYYPII